MVFCMLPESSVLHKRPIAVSSKKAPQTLPDVVVRKPPTGSWGVEWIHLVSKYRTPKQAVLRAKAQMIKPLSLGLSGWWLSHLPLWKIWVSWDDEIPDGKS